MAPLPQGTGILRQKNISKSSIFRSETNILGGRQWAIYFFKKLHNQQEFWFARLGLITSENPAYFGDEKEAKISDGDSVIANATIEVILLQNQKHSVVVGPFPFNQKMTHCTVPLIETTKLLQNKFVIENDTCELHYQINVDKPQNNAEYLEILKMEEIEVEPINKHDYMSSYTVRKNKELCKSMKLRLKGCVTKDGVSSVFVLNGIPFQLMTCKIKHDKDGVDHLGIQLINSLEDDFSRGSCKVNIRCVISSSDWNISPISMEVIDETFKSKFHHLSLPLMTWEVLTKPSNFFVKNDSFLLEVDMTVERIGELKFYMPVENKFTINGDASLSRIDSQQMETKKLHSTDPDVGRFRLTTKPLTSKCADPVNIYSSNIHCNGKCFVIGIKLGKSAAYVFIKNIDGAYVEISDCKHIDFLIDGNHSYHYFSAMYEEDGGFILEYSDIIPYRTGSFIFDVDISFVL